jgi:hypothetical protein
MSSTPSYGETITLDTDHGGLNKFYSPYDPNYLIFLRRFRKAFDLASKSGEQALRHFTYTTDIILLVPLEASRRDPMISVSPENANADAVPEVPKGLEQIEDLAVDQSEELPQKNLIDNDETISKVIAQSTVPYDRNDKFQGQESIMAMLEERFSKPESHRRVALVGEGGTG